MAIASGIAIALVLSLLVNLGFLISRLRAQTGKFLIAGDDEAYLLRDRKTGTISRLEPGMKVKPGDARIVTFEKRNRLCFPVYDRVRRELSDRELTSESGGISLRIHTTTPAPFPVITNDGHSVFVTASVSFAVQKARAQQLAQLADFGAQLERRIQSAFGSAIGELRDEEMRQNLGRIEARVTEELEQMETQQNFGVPLGIKVYEARFQYEDTGTAGRNITILEPAAGRPAAAASGTDADAAPPTAQVVTLQAGPAAPGPGSSPGGRPGAMQFAGTELDKLLDQFKNRSPEQVAALLKLMELQTRQNIVSELAQSGGVIVFSAKELGLGGNPVVEESVTSQLSGKLPAAKAAE